MPNLKIMPCRNLHNTLRDVYYWYCFHPLGERVNSDEKKLVSSQCPRYLTHDVDSPDCEWRGEIDRPKRIDMLGCLLLEELTIPAFGDYLQRVILSCRPVESVSECLVDDREP
jgi:hypothetical protein